MPKNFNYEFYSDSNGDFRDSIRFYYTTVKHKGMYKPITPEDVERIVSVNVIGGHVIDIANFAVIFEYFRNVSSVTFTSCYFYSNLTWIPTNIKILYIRDCEYLPGIHPDATHHQKMLFSARCPLIVADHIRFLHITFQNESSHKVMTLDYRCLPEKLRILSIDSNNINFDFIPDTLQKIILKTDMPKNSIMWRMKPIAKKHPCLKYFLLNGIDIFDEFFDSPVDEPEDDLYDGIPIVGAGVGL